MYISVFQAEHLSRLQWKITLICLSTILRFITLIQCISFDKQMPDNGEANKHRRAKNKFRLIQLI